MTRVQKLFRVLLILLLPLIILFSWSKVVTSVIDGVLLAVAASNWPLAAAWTGLTVFYLFPVIIWIVVFRRLGSHEAG
jgi:hypothetical protein